MLGGQRWNMRLQDREVIRAIHRLNEPITIVEIASMLGCGEKTVRRAIKRLNPVVRPTSGGNRIPYTYEIAYDLLPEDLRRELSNGNGR